MKLFQDSTHTEQNGSPSFSLVRLALLTAAEGVIALLLSLRTRSEAQSAVLFGLSRERLFLLGLILFMIGAWFAALLNARRIEARIKSSAHIEFAALFMRLSVWIIGFILLFCFYFAYAPIRSADSTVHSILSRAAPLLIWFFLSALQTAVYIRQFERGKLLTDGETRWLITALFLFIFAFGFRYYDSIDWTRRLNFSAFVFLTPAFLAVIVSVLKIAARNGCLAAERITPIFFYVFVFFLVFAFHRSVSYWAVRTDSPAKAYWAELADAFLNGRLYLMNPATNHDLTMFNGEWYVPNPPLPAIVLMPFVALFGVEGVNMTVVSALIGAGNVVLMMLVLRAAVSAGFFKLSDEAVFWLAATFAVGTNHLWLVTLGQMWFVSQLTTVFFVGLACLAALRAWSPWLTGLFLGCAMLSRPNVFPIALFLAGAEAFRIRRQTPGGSGAFDWRRFVVWGVQAAVPAAASGALLLFYNWLRFGDWFDFGYIAINGAPFILEAVRTYGMFHPHFFSANWRTMILTLPRIVPANGGAIFHPGIGGYSIFAMTPPTVYAFLRPKRTLWLVGAWLSIAVSSSFLLLYHNTGAEQIGYRYLMDFVFPLFILIANGMDGVPSWFFKASAAVGTFVNLLAMYWWYFLR